MQILVLTSRYTATRDIIGEDFGRQTRLFSALKKLRHSIDFFVADYRKFEKKDTKLHGINVAIRPFSIFYFFSFLSSLDNTMKNKRYDVLIASSDPLWGIIGYIFAKKNKTRFLYDLHDNYEIYATYKIPFFRYIDNYVIRKSDLVTTVSYALKDKIKHIRKHKVFVVQNGFDDKLFRPIEKMKCRKLLRLPEHGKLLVYTGSIQEVQGLHILIDAFNDLKNEIPDLYLVLAGRFYKNEKKYFNLNQENIIYLGSLTQDKVALLINAADVAIVPNADNDFTRYCFPYKIVEYMGCNVPIVATKLGDVNRLLSNYKASLCEPNNAKDMSDKIKLQLNKNRINYRKTAIKNAWGNIAKKLDAALKK